MGSDDKKEDFSSHKEYLAQELFDKYPTLLKKGFAIEHLPNVHQALSGTFHSLVNPMRDCF